MRDRWKRVWYSQDEIELLLVPILLPALSIRIALHNKREVLGHRFLGPRFDEVRVERIAFDIPQVPGIDLLEDSRGTEHAQGFAHGGVVVFAVANRAGATLRCGQVSI